MLPDTRLFSNCKNVREHFDKLPDIRLFSNHKDAREHFDKQRSALARLVPAGVLIFVPACAAIGHSTGEAK